MKELTISASPIVGYFYIISGFILVGIGIIGIFLPLLPTTIFLILASYCFIKSSPKANDWLRNHKILGAYVKNYQDKSGLTIKSKISNIVLLWISIAISSFFFTDELYVKLVLFFVAIAVTIHLLMIKTKQLENK